MIDSQISPCLLGVKIASGKTQSDNSATRGSQLGKAKRRKTLPKEKFYKFLMLRKGLFSIDPYVFPLQKDSNGELMKDKNGRLKAVPCSLYYDELKHDEVDERLYKSIGCQKRAVCPICGASYWREKGKEARSLFEAQRYRALLMGWRSDQWLLDFEFTIPVVLSRLIDVMSLEGKRKYLNELSRACYNLLYGVLGKSIGGVADLHFWASKNPLLPHYHFHLEVSPFKADGDLVLPNPVIAKEILEDIRDSWRGEVSDIFGIDFKQSFNVHYQFVQENDKTSYEQVKNKFCHRFNYCFRHWTEDLLKYRGKVSKGNLIPAIKRAKELAGITKIRWFGYMSTTKRKKAGFSLVKYLQELTICPDCGKEFETEDLIDTLAMFGGMVVCPTCDHHFKESELGKKSKWRRTGNVFVLRGFRKNGVLLVNKDTGEKKLVPYERVSLFPSKGKRKRFVCRDPDG